MFWKTKKAKERYKKYKKAGEKYALLLEYTVKLKIENEKLMDLLSRVTLLLEKKP